MDHGAPTDNGAHGAPNDPGDISREHARLWLLAILIFALAIRVVYVLQSRASPLFDAPQMDALYHVEWARALAHGREYQPGPFFRAPGYPWFLAALTRVFGDDLLGPRIVQAIVGTVSCALIYLLGARLYDRRTGLVAAAITSAYAMLVYFDGELLLPVLEVPTCAAAVLLALRCVDPVGWRSTALAGVALGVAAIVRPNVLLWGLLVAIWMVARGGAPLGGRIRQSVMYGAFALLAILPITAYNAFAGHDRVLISSQGGLNLWIGNNPSSDGSTAIAPGTRPDWWGGYEDVIAQAEAAEGRELRPSEVSRHYTRRALDWISDEPLAALRHFAWKLRLYWTDYELGNNQDEVFFAHEFGPVLRYDPVRFGLVVPLGLVGLLLAVRHWRRNGAALLFVPAWCASVVLFFVCARFRIPMIPVLAVFAAHAALVGWRAASAHDWRRLTAIAIGAGGIALLVQLVPARIDRTPAKGLWQLGVLRFQAGDFREAERLLTESIAQNPRFPIARQDLGWTLLREGRAQDALAQFDAASSLDPATIGALQGRVESLWALQRQSDAVTAARAFVVAAPLLFTAQYTLARALLASTEPNRDVEARASLRAAIEHAGSAEELFNAHFLLGELERTASRTAPAIAAYDAAIAARPEPDAEGWFWTCQATRLGVIAQSGDRERARREARALVARWPEDSRGVASLRAFLTE